VKRVLLLTGAPGVGKTTVLIKAVEALKARGISVGGMVSREVRGCCGRVGFEIFDLTSGKHCWLAHINLKNGPQVGKYRVKLDDLDGVGATAIFEALAKSQVVAIDEIGPMELYSERFKDAVKQALDGGKPVLAVVHAKAKDALIAAAKGRADAQIYIVTVANRERLPEELSQKIVSLK
jgi:nucleoside-triphosphatase